MDGRVDALRAAHLRVIFEDPVTATITRTEKVDNGVGGWEENELTFQTTVRIVPTHDKPFTKTNEAGQLRLSGWSVLAPWESDLRDGDELSTNDGRTFNVIRVVRRSYAGQIYAVQGMLEEVT